MISIIKMIFISIMFSSISIKFIIITTAGGPGKRKSWGLLRLMHRYGVALGYLCFYIMSDHVSRT